MMYDSTLSCTITNNPLRSTKTNCGNTQASPMSKSTARDKDFMHNYEQVFYPDKYRVQYVKKSLECRFN